MYEILCWPARGTIIGNLAPHSHSNPYVNDHFQMLFFVPLIPSPIVRFFVTLSNRRIDRREATHFGRVLLRPFPRATETNSLEDVVALYGEEKRQRLPLEAQYYNSIG